MLGIDSLAGLVGRCRFIFDILAMFMLFRNYIVKLTQQGLINHFSLDT